MVKHVSQIFMRKFVEYVSAGNYTGAKVINNEEEY